ncbi:hypothetical protein EB796_009874 [Bugula neritina]|uniref:Uncharacterized protein n=1 Tax=Bugula neritina TaxID=10212 RepID=A0A7J7K0W7_BUGNE|nr:hypothetical protein EB796_009874 [Bugula neritina]
MTKINLRLNVILCSDLYYISLSQGHRSKSSANCSATSTSYKIQYKPKAYNCKYNNNDNQYAIAELEGEKLKL